MRVLIVEDDPVVGEALERGLGECGFACHWVRDGDEGLERARSHSFEFVILDVLLPGRNGLDVLRCLRRAGVQVPVLLLTALGAIDDRVAGLEAGADDYLIKPFAFAELLARLEAVRRRSQVRPAPVLEVGDLRLDLTARRVTRAGVRIDLTPTEFSLLELLMRHAGQVVTRRMLSQHLWQADWDGATNVLAVHVNRLRGKLDEGFDTSAIQTVRGRGYAIAALPLSFTVAAPELEPCQEIR